MTEANRGFQSGDYDLALRLYEQGLQASRSRGDELNAACFLAGVGNYRVVAHQYRDALDAYLQATKAAIKAGHHDLALRVAVNRATLYRRMGENAAAAEAMREVREIVPAQPPAWLLIQAGNLTFDDAGIDRASPFFIAAADRAAADGDASTQASALGQLGYLSLQAGRTGAAEKALTEAFRIRKLSGNKQTVTLNCFLSMLRLAQGDAASALHLIDRALETPSKTTVIAPAFLHFQRARALAASHQLRAALEEYEIAIGSARDWRLRVLPADAFRIGADVTLQEIYSSYIEAAMAQHGIDGDPRLRRRAFEIAETNRAASLRESAQDRTGEAEYWETVEKLRAELAAGASDHDVPGGRADMLRTRLADLELGRGGGIQQISHQIKERSFSENSLSLLQRNLSGDEVLLSFHTAGTASYLWAMTRDSFESHILPSRPDIAIAANAFSTAVKASSGSIPQTGAALSGMLFARLGARAAGKASWILSLDEPLYGVPFGALPDPRNAGRYLAADRTLRIVPGAAMMDGTITAPVSTRFVGIADPVYNRADARWRSTQGKVSAELPRLPGTRAEVSGGAAAWSSPATPVVLTGFDVNRAAVQRSTSEQAGVVHFATHVVPDPAMPGSVAIALGLRTDGTAEYLRPADIAGWRCRAGAVVLSGCGSGTGKALPGAGIVGLTRAWLVAGANSVMATYWPIPDDAEVFFRAFYASLGRTAKSGISASAAAGALRAAQLEMIRGGGAHARPEYWAAFFVVGKD
jgi:tetratricopeptide (TPR) repeat protein